MSTIETIEILRAKGLTEDEIEDEIQCQVIYILQGDTPPDREMEVK